MIKTSEVRTQHARKRICLFDTLSYVPVLLYMVILIVLRMQGK